MPADNATPLSTARFQSGNAGETTPAAKSPAAKPGELDKFQREVLLVVEQGKNLFLTGEAGAGKSHLLEHMRTHLPGKKISICAPAWKAAARVRDTSIHW